MPVTHVLHNGPVKVLESEGWITSSLANEVPSHVIEQANRCRLPFTMVSIYTVNGGNHE